LAELRPDGSVDTDFGDEGVLEIEYADVAVDRRGRILLTSSRRISDDSSDLTVTRLLPTGNLDTSFGTGGTATVDLGGRMDGGSAVYVQPDGRILVGGFTANVEDRGRSDGFAVIVRLLADGTLDRSFRRGGRGTLGRHAPLVEEGIVLDFAKGPRGSTYAALGDEGQMEIVRLRPNGKLDSSFGDRGGVTVGGFNAIPGTEFFAPISKIGVLPNGRLIVAGTVSGNGVSYAPAVLRYRQNGLLDRGFGNGGWKIARFKGETFAQSFALQRSGRVIVASSTHPNAGNSSYLSLDYFRPDGALDRRLGRRGHTSIGGFGHWSHAAAVVLQRPQRAVIIGSAQDETRPYGPNRIVLARVPLKAHRVR